MKRHGNVWQQVVSFEALLRAADDARKGNRFRPGVREMQADYAAGRVPFAEIHQRLMSWSGHARQANTFLLRCRLFDTVSFQRATTE